MPKYAHPLASTQSLSLHVRKAEVKVTQAEQAAFLLVTGAAAVAVALCPCPGPDPANLLHSPL